jgi:RNA polymerase sigma-70 factor (ECF subfamily)
VLLTADRSDAALVAALKCGDERAFEELVERYHAPLRRFAMTYVRNPAVADEVVQETWLGVIRGIERFEGRASLKTWIFQILSNNAISRAERERRTVPFSTFYVNEDDGPAVDPLRFLDENHDRWPGHWAAPLNRWNELPEDALYGHETLSLLWQTIEELPDVQRRVIVLRDVEGWSSDEVCSMLELSEANQRVLLHRARSRCRTALESHFDGPGTAQLR